MMNQEEEVVFFCEVIQIPCTEFGTGSIIEVDPDGDPHI